MFGLHVFILNSFVVLSVVILRSLFLPFLVIFLSFCQETVISVQVTLKIIFLASLEFWTWVSICLLDNWEIEGCRMSQSLYFVNLKIPCSIHMNVYFPFLHTSSSDLPLTRNVGVISALFLSSLAPFNFVDSIPIIIYNVIASFPFLPFPRI